MTADGLAGGVAADLLVEAEGWGEEADLLALVEACVGEAARRADAEILPGSEVSVFLNGTDPGTGQPFTRLLLPRVTVLGVGSTAPVSTTTTDDGGNQTVEELPRTLLTVAVDQGQAQKVLYASTNGELAFALLNGQSAVKAGSTGVTAANLFR